MIDHSNCVPFFMVVFPVSDQTSVEHQLRSLDWTQQAVSPQKWIGYLKRQKETVGESAWQRVLNNENIIHDCLQMFSNF